MKLLRSVAICCGFLAICGCANQNHVSQKDKILLPNKYSVFTNHSVVINHPYPSFERKILPVVNSYKKTPGCYLACYSHNPQAVYSVTPTIFVEGMVRVNGMYEGRNCSPSVFLEGTDIGSIQRFKDLCNSKLKGCKETKKATGEGCWAGGDTGGFFGVQ